MRVRAPRIVSHLTYANVMSTLAVFLIVCGGTAYAANTVFSTDIVDGQVMTLDLGSNAVTTGKIKTGAVTGTDLAADVVDGPKVLDDSLTATDLGPGSVGTSEVIDNSITSTDVTDESLTLKDLVGADVTGIMAFTLPAQGCMDLALTVSGAKLGQAVLLSFTSGGAPQRITFSPGRVTAANAVAVRTCNPTASSITIVNLGYRILTFG